MRICMPEEDWDLTIRFRESGYKISRADIFIEHDEGEDESAW